MRDKIDRIKEALLWWAYLETKDMDERKIPKEVKQRYLKIANICKKYDVPVPAAAIQFCYTNKLVTSMILGMDRLDQVEQNLEFLNFPIPEDLWKDLLNEKLIDERCPL